MSVPIPPLDPYNQAPPLWRHLVSLLPLAIWPVGAFLLLLGSAAEGENFLGRGFIALAGAPWWALTGTFMVLVSATLLPLPATLRVAGDVFIGASSLALLLSWGLDPATATGLVGTPLWGCLLFSTGIALIDAGITAQERRASPPQSENGA